MTQKLVTETTGAFRFITVKKDSSGKNSSIRVLALLPLEETLSSHLCREAMKLASRSNQRVDLVFKLHPASNSAHKDRSRFQKTNPEEYLDEEHFMKNSRKPMWLLIMDFRLARSSRIRNSRWDSINPDGLYHNPIPYGAANKCNILLDSPDSFDLLLKISKKTKIHPNPKIHSDILERSTRSAALELLGL